MGAKASETRSFQVAITSRAAILTVDALSASFDFLIEMILVATKTGRKRMKPGRAPRPSINSFTVR